MALTWTGPSFGPTLSNSNRTAANGSGDARFIGGQDLDGTRYFEVDVGARTGNAKFGLADLSYDSGDQAFYVGGDFHTPYIGWDSVGAWVKSDFGNTTHIASGFTFPTTGQRLCVAVDVPNRNVWFRVNNGNWNGSGTADPATGTGGFTIPNSYYPLRPHWRWDSGSTSDNVTLKSLPGDWTYTAPTGFTAPGATSTVGAVSVTGTLAATEAADAAAVSGSVAAAVTGTLSATEAFDAAVVSGSVVAAVSGTLAATGPFDTASISGSVANNVGTLSATEATDTAAFAGNISTGVAGTLATTEAVDIAAISGSVAAPSVTGSLATTEAIDTASLSGSVVPAVTGSLNATGALDTASVSGSVASAITGSLAATDAQDSAAVAAIIANALAGALAATEGIDTLRAIQQSGNKLLTIEMVVDFGYGTGGRSASKPKLTSYQKRMAEMN